MIWKHNKNGLWLLLQHSLLYWLHAVPNRARTVLVPASNRSGTEWKPMCCKRLIQVKHLKVSLDRLSLIPWTGYINTTVTTCNQPWRPKSWSRQIMASPTPLRYAMPSGVTAPRLQPKISFLLGSEPLIQLPSPLRPTCTLASRMRTTFVQAKSQQQIWASRLLMIKL